ATVLQQPDDCAVSKLGGRETREKAVDLLGRKNLWKRSVIAEQSRLVGDDSCARANRAASRNGVAANAGLLGFQSKVRVPLADRREPPHERSRAHGLFLAIGPFPLSSDKRDGVAGARSQRVDPLNRAEAEPP